MNFLSVSDAARLLETTPKCISDLFYQRKLRDDACPVVGGRRLIPIDYLPVIHETLVSHGLVPCPGADEPSGLSVSDHRPPTRSVEKESQEPATSLILQGGDRE